MTLTPVGVTTAGVNPDTASTRPPASVSVSTPQPSANLRAIALNRIGPTWDNPKLCHFWGMVNWLTVIMTNKNDVIYDCPM